jgi:hypothetical protein
MTSPALSPRKQRLIEAFRAVLRESTGYPDADEAGRASLYASIGGDPDLLAVWREETAPAQAALDLHLAGEGVDDHATNARQFAGFVAGVSTAVKATVKDRLGRRAHTEDLLIEALQPGSLRVVLRARDPITDDPTITEPGSTLDSDALRGIASVLMHAGDDTDDSPLTAELGRLPAKARQGLRRAARSIAQAGWDIAGAVTQRGYGYGELALTARAARALERQLGQALPQKTHATVYGQITGTKDIEGVLWFQPEGGGREFRASIDDEQLRRRAVEYQIDHPRVHAVFDVYESLPPGDDTIIRTSRTLTNLTLAPTGEQGTLDNT